MVILRPLSFRFRKLSDKRAETNYGHSVPCVNQEERIQEYQDDVGRLMLIIFKFFAGSAGREIDRPNGVSLE